jgi:PTS system maltose and glucose-specific IIC component
MKEKVMDGLQRFSKAMFVPVLILPIAGILIAIGNIFTNQRLLEVVPFMDNPITTGFGTILAGSLVSILTNLGVIFCVGLAVGLAKKKKAEAGFTALLAFLVFINAMNKFLELKGMLVKADDLQGTGQASILGIQILDMGVFLGIILGITVGLVHNRFVDTEFHSAFQIYGGSRFVFIVLIPVTVLLAIILTFIWPFVQTGITSLGHFINQSGNFGLFLYGSLERLLIPTGLHHLVYTPFLYTSLGGVETIGGHVYEGARNIYYAEMADPNIHLLSRSVIWDARGISKMFGLIGACLAMYQTAKPENKVKVKAILIPAVVTSFVAGVTEPIEFSFMFLAPMLFVLHAGLSGLSMVVLNMLNVRAIGPNGFLDFLLYNVPLGVAKTHWPMYIVVGIAFFFIYFALFKFLIIKFNLKTVGREDSSEETRLYTKNDLKVKEAVQKNQKGTESGDAVPVTTIIEAMGGADNFESVTNCYTRLRTVLKDPTIVDEATLKEETGANAVIIKGNNVHVVYGLKVTAVRNAVDEALGFDNDELE